MSKGRKARQPLTPERIAELRMKINNPEYMQNAVNKLSGFVVRKIKEENFDVQRYSKHKTITTD